LLSGSQPFPGTGRGRLELLNVITSQDPLPPSAAANTSPLPSQREVGQQFTGDLDAIVLRAMHRDPARRYQSAAELSSDINRYLENRPVTARKTSVADRSKKFFARHRGVVLATFVICILLAATTWQGLEMHKRYEHSQELETQLRTLQIQLAERVKQFKPELTNSNNGEMDSPMAKQLQETELRNVKNLTDAYRTSFPEAVRLWPGVTRSRQDLIGHTDQYLREVEPYVIHDPQASEQLASAWLWLANLQGNPQTINLHDRAGATASINQATRLLEKSGITTTSLNDQVRRAAQQIEGQK
jgi:serine/threonine-protein kinase